MARKVLPVIMCGGAGTRVWPESRETMPKQFIPLIGTASTFQQTIKRVDAPMFDDAGGRHQPRLPLPGARAARGDRRQGADRHRAGAPRFRRGGGGRRRDRRGARSADGRGGVRRRPCRARPEGLPRRLRAPPPKPPPRGRDRDARRHADRAGDRLRLHPSRRFARRRRRAPRRRLRREAQPSRPPSAT